MVDHIETEQPCKADNNTKRNHPGWPGRVSAEEQDNSGKLALWLRGNTESDTVLNGAEAQEEEPWVHTASDQGQMVHGDKPAMWKPELQNGIIPQDKREMLEKSGLRNRMWAGGTLQTWIYHWADTIIQRLNDGINQ